MTRSILLGRIAVAMPLALLLACTDAGDPVLPAPLAPPAPPEPIVVDFESPQVGDTGSEVIDPYLDEASGIWFCARCPGQEHGQVGFVRSAFSSVCVEFDGKDQKLGTGPCGADEVGRSCFAVAAVLPAPLDGGAEVSVEFQSLAGCELRLQLFDVHRQLLAETLVLAGPPLGPCGFPGGSRAVTTLSARTWEQLGYAVMCAERGHVFLIDDFTVLPHEE